MKFVNILFNFDEKLERWIRTHHTYYLFILGIVGFIIAFLQSILLSPINISQRTLGLGFLYSFIFFAVDLMMYGKN